jgi:hypothetical protein
MKGSLSIVGVLAMAASATATPTLQFDVNDFSTQARNSANVNGPFGGLTHTGSVAFSVGAGTLEGIFIQSVAGGAFNNAGFSGSTMTGFSGEVDLVNGHVTGGSITLTISSGDSYSCSITPGVGQVSNYVGGGFKIEALTSHGMFSDSQFGNVSVAPWFNAQGGPNGLPGSFLQFNFNPNAQGAATSDMDLFVDVVPLPPTVWAGLALIGGAMTVRRMRKR